MSEYVITNQYIDSNGNGQDLIIPITKEIPVSAKETIMIIFTEFGEYPKDRFELMLSNFVSTNSFVIPNSKGEAIDALGLFINKNIDKMTWKSINMKEIEGENEWECRLTPSTGVHRWFRR